MIQGLRSLHSSIAQLVELETVNFAVPGSSPGGGVGDTAKPNPFRVLETSLTRGGFIV